MRLLFVGAPGVGKGTQAKKLADGRAILHISTGDILREEIRHSTPAGLKAKSFVDSGGLVPDEVMVSIIEDRFAQGDTPKGYLLDGFPRTVPQAVALDGLLRRLRLPLERVILLECPDGAIMERITGRRTCEKCGTPFHLEHRKPRAEGLCDGCGGKLVQREDDTEPKVCRRLAKYYAETVAIISFYEKQGMVRRVDASRKLDEVTRAVEDAVVGL
jgi:adenylate kinase